MSTDLSLRIVVGATDAASSVVNAVGQKIVGIFGGGSAAQQAATNIAAGFATIVGGAVAIGVHSTLMAADFQTAMLSNVAHAGLAKDQFDSVSQSVLSMASAVGRSPTQLAEALYPILSAFSGIQNQSAKSAISLDTLRMSFQTVAGTTVDGTAVANAAVGTFNSLGLATNNVSLNTQRMTGLFDVMDKTVQLGNMQWDAYKNVVSKLAVAIQGTGISFNESQAALATMTNEGFSAQRASTYLSNTFTTLAIKTDALSKHAKKLGISFDESKYNALDFAGKIEYLNQVTDGNKQKLLALMGNNSTALKTFNALSVGIGAYRSNLQSLNHAHGALASSFATASQGFNFQMQQMKAAGDALMITIGTQLLPVFSKLITQITPLIQQFTTWLVKSGALQAIAHGLSAALTFLVNAIVILVTWGVQLVGFFQHSQLALDILIAVLAGVAGGILAFAATAIPALVAGFIAWAIAAGSAAVATLIAAAPFILIGAIIAVVVLGIILAIQHWGQIMAWLQGVWHAFSSWFMGLLGGIGAGFHAFWNGLVTVVQTVLKILFVILFGQFILIGLLFVWLYNHNTYVKKLVDAIVGFFKAAIAWLVNAWHVCVAAVVAAWNWLSDEAKMLLAELVVLFQAGIQWIVDQWNGFIDSIKHIWQVVSDFFAGIWNNYIAPPLRNLWNSIVNFLSGWPKQMVQFGINLIQGFINGILSMVGNVGGAVGQIMGKITGFLGFHSPAKEGPGQHLLEWPRNMVKSYADEMAAQTPYLQSKVSMLVAPLAMMSHAVPLTGGHTSTPLTTTPGSAGGTVINVTVNAPARTQDEATEIAQAVSDRLSQMLRGQGTLAGGLFS